MRTSSAAIAVTLVALTAACGSTGSATPGAASSAAAPTAASATPTSAPSPTTTPAPSVDLAGYCTRLTAPEVAAAVGNPVTLEVKAPGQCWYTTETNGHFEVTVMLRPAAGAERFLANDKGNRAQERSTVTALDGYPISYLAYGPRPGSNASEYSFTGEAAVVSGGGYLIVQMSQTVLDPLVPDSVGLPKFRAVVALALQKVPM